MITEVSEKGRALVFKWASLLCAFCFVAVVGMATLRCDRSDGDHRGGPSGGAGGEWTFISVGGNLACVNPQTQQAFVSLYGLSQWQKIRWPETPSGNSLSAASSTGQSESQDAMIERLLDEATAADAERIVAVARNRGVVIRAESGDVVSEAEIVQHLRRAAFGGTAQIEALIRRLVRGEALEPATEAERASH